MAEESHEQNRVNMPSLYAVEEDIQAEERPLQNREHMKLVRRRSMKMKEILKTVHEMRLQR